MAMLISCYFVISTDIADRWGVERGLMLVVSWGEGDRVLYNVRISIPRLVKTHFTKANYYP
jgi:hypothetical protein